MLQDEGGRLSLFNHMSAVVQDVDLKQRRCLLRLHALIGNVESRRSHTSARARSGERKSGLSGHRPWVESWVVGYFRIYPNFISLMVSRTMVHLRRKREQR
jgi:hypothetical protein